MGIISGSCSFDRRVDQITQAEDDDNECTCNKVRFDLSALATLKYVLPFETRQACSAQHAIVALLQVAKTDSIAWFIFI